MKPPIRKGSMGSIEIRKVVAVSSNCMGRSCMSVPLRVRSDSERRRGQESSTWPVDGTSEAPTLRWILEGGEGDSAKSKVLHTTPYMKPKKSQSSSAK